MNWIGLLVVGIAAAAACHAAVGDTSTSPESPKLVQTVGLPKQEPPAAILRNLDALMASAKAAGTAGADYWTWAEQNGVWTENGGYPAYDPSINDPRVPPAKYLGPGGVYYPFVQLERAYYQGSGVWPSMDYTPAQDRYVRGN